MSTTLYHIALVIHVVGITVMAGTTFIDFIIFRAFWRTFPVDLAKGIVLESYLYRLQRLLGIGLLIILISGILMMVRLHEVWGAQVWFRVKMGVLLLIIINGLGFRRRLGAQLKRILNRDASKEKETASGQDALRRNFNAVQLVQLLLFIIIYVLSVFKFN